MAETVKLTAIQRKFTKKYGEYSMTLANDASALSAIPYGISSQSLCLDLALGRAGFPAGRLTEIGALTHQGKSTLSYHVIKECQRLGGVGVLMETENAFEEYRLKDIGVDVNTLILLQPEFLEKAFDMLLTIMQELREEQHIKEPIVIVLDSVAGTPTQAEYEGGYDEQYMAAAARVISLGLRKLVRPLAKYKVVLLFLNQLRSSMERYGDPYVSYGGKSIGIASSIRIRLTTRKADIIKVHGRMTGAWTNVNVIKNKLATPFQTTKYLLDFATGIDQVEDCWSAALKLGVLKIKNKAFELTLGEKSYAVDRAKFEEFINTKYKSPQKLKDALTRVAIERRLLLPYGG